MKNTPEVIKERLYKEYLNRRKKAGKRATRYKEVKKTVDNVEDSWKIDRRQKLSRLVKNIDKHSKYWREGNPLLENEILRLLDSYIDEYDRGIVNHTLQLLSELDTRKLTKEQYKLKFDYIYQYITDCFNQDKLTDSWLKYQECQDPGISAGFKKLHTSIVNQVAQFCKKYRIQATGFQITTDRFLDSVKQGEWCPGTDSCFDLDCEVDLDYIKQYYPDYYKTMSQDEKNLIDYREDFINSSFLKSI